MSTSNNDYAQYIGRKWLMLAVLSVLMLGVALLSLSVGAARLPLSEILRVFAGAGEDASRTIIFNVRLPRIATAVMVGIALAMAGCVMQNVLRNPLASASTLGISQGASFGAAVAIVYFEAGVRTGIVSGATIMAANPFTITIFAFIGGICTTILILLLSYRSGAVPSIMILAGVAIGAMFTGATALVQYFADDVRVGSIVYWTFGNLGRPGWQEIRILFYLNIAGFLYFIFNRWNYNAMESGTHTAKSLGVNVDVLILVSMAVSTLISATAIAFVGTINFVGLIAPHIMRKFVGNDYRFLIPTSAFMGAIVMLVADIASRMLQPPAVLPIGALTSFLGAPLFLYMIIRKGHTAQ
ncbi:MAG: iron ABC transporter permease [Defluviitaleaceae bacterium]|nr:iron ABC transporter permease [Defluviitaleaceae bacterium]